MNESVDDTLSVEHGRSSCDKSTQTGEVEEIPVDKDSDYYKRNELPVDRGWAWAVCFGGFFVSFNLGLANQTMALLFVEVMELFDATLTTASLVFLFYILGLGIMCLANQTMALLFVEVMELFDATLTTASLVFLFYILGLGIMSPISTNFLVPKVGEKRVICISGFFFSLASVGYYSASSIQTFLQCALLQGLCTGAVFVPSISLLRHYFHQRRSFALNLGRAGGSASGILMPYLIRLIRNEFGVRGTFLIVGAFELHIVLAGLLLRPVQAYKFKPDLPPLKPKWQKKGKSTKTDKLVDVEDSHISKPNQKPILKIFGNSRRNVTSANEESGERHSTHYKEDVEMSSFKQSPNSDERTDDEKEKQLIGDHACGNGEKSTLLEVPSTISSQESPDNQTGNTESDYLRPRTFTMTSMDLPEASALVLDCTEEEEEETAREKQVPKSGQFYRLWSFYMMLVYALVGAGNVYIRNYVPTIAVGQGASLDQAALLLTMIGILDVTSRLGVGFFADTHLLTPAQIVATSHVCLGIVCHLARFFTTFPMLVLMTTIIATFLGTRISMTPLICMDVVGVDMMPQAFSIVNTVGTFSVAAMNPSLGAVAESFGSFVPVLHILGVLFFTSASILLMLPICQRIDKRRGYHTPT